MGATCQHWLGPRLPLPLKRGHRIQAHERGLAGGSSESPPQKLNKHPLANGNPCSNRHDGQVPIPPGTDPQPGPGAAPLASSSIGAFQRPPKPPAPWEVGMRLFCETSPACGTHRLPPQPPAHSRGEEAPGLEVLTPRYKVLGSIPSPQICLLCPTPPPTPAHPHLVPPW